MEEEFRFHLEMEQARLMRDGFSPEAARRQARVTFGGLDGHRETMREGVARAGSTTSARTSDTRSAPCGAAPATPAAAPPRCRYRRERHGRRGT